MPAIRIVEISHPLPDCTRLTLEPVESRFSPVPGQHLVLDIPTADGVLKRCYSLHDGPFSDAPLQITVRRIPNGRASNAIFETLTPGMVLQCSQPAGRFAIEATPQTYRHIYLYAAGTGITPIIAMAHALLARAPHSIVSLLYGNRARKRILFADRLAALQAEHPRRFSVDHVLSAPGMFDASPDRKGRIDAEAVAWFLARRPARIQNVGHYICGPGAMNAAVEQALLALGAPQDAVHTEQFGAASLTSGQTGPTGIAAELNVRWNGQTHACPVAAGETMLQAMRRAGFEPPFGCESGICGACVAQLTAGDVHQRAHMALDARDLKAGRILACQAVPQSSPLTIEYA